MVLRPWKEEDQSIPESEGGKGREGEEMAVVKVWEGGEAEGLWIGGLKEGSRSWVWGASGMRGSSSAVGAGEGVGGRVLEVRGLEMGLRM